MNAYNANIPFAECSSSKVWLATCGLWLGCSSPLKKARRRGDRDGFTLIEILVALLVLVIGLASVASLLFAGRRVSNTTVDRNIAQIIITEAVADIERAHLITENMVAATHKADVGLFLETVVGGTPSIHDTTYGTAFISDGKTFNDHLTHYCGLGCYYPQYPKKEETNTLIWPFVNNPKYTGGMFSSSSPNYDAKKDLQAIAYYVIYRLERHPKWLANDLGYQGTYVLTLVVYRDLAINRDSYDKKSRLEQVTDPVVVYLRDKKIR
ncbi:MAG: prepilin-type N-terminal cleavage/methylation domain-containing protein [Planctomycetota bacterium]